ncbi:MAG: aminotransferase class I/II-fold pyridoxal phosphate-dependent enzyme, partial [Firmicutes bacterium]|nr:aminotransferase class I/II-fold pyridoxal phosphate-dependent enzyme [Bacillota bacterium]
MSLTNQHGGDLDYIHRVYNIPRDEIIDFSGNVNPIGISPSVKKAITENIDLLSTYPDVNYTSLRSAISSYTGAKAENIIVGNGSTELISLFIKSVCPKKSVIISPAYSEYEREIKLCGGKPLLFPLREEEDFRLNIPDLFNAMDKDTNLLVICNPNNPTGSFLVKSELLRIAEFCRGNNIRILIDETYAEFSDDDMEVSAIPLADDFKNIFIIRGTSKFFASPGLRLGYAITSDTDITDTINKKKDPWSVNILASVGGEEMFKDTAYINET